MFANLSNFVQKEWFILLLLAFLTIPLRFIHLGYSDYVKDEHRTLYDDRVKVPTLQYFLSQRKGPMQIFVSYIPYLFAHDFNNELAERIPYALINVASVLVFYKLVLKLTQKRLTALISALLYLVNGFISGFGRIVQYQNLNLLFTFMALILYADLLKPTDFKKSVKKSLLGTLFFSLSVLSHWDAVFVIAPISIIFFIFAGSKSFIIKDKLLLLVVNFLLGCLILLPYLIPYINYQATSTANENYFFRRVGMGEKDHSFKTLIELYNPFVFYWLWTVGVVIGAFFIKKSYLFLSWFVFTYIIFEFFVIKPGTHIYNFVVPGLVLSAIGIEKIISILPKYLKLIPAVSFVVAFSFLYYQTYVLFVDHTIEYPWKQETLLGKYKTINYEKYKVLPLFGFPLKRDWDQINKYINEQNGKGEKQLGYITNEDASTSSFYMDTYYGQSSPQYYYVAIKRPLSFVNDWKAVQIGKKSTVHEIVVNDETVVKIYLVQNKEQ